MKLKELTVWLHVSWLPLPLYPCLPHASTSKFILEIFSQKPSNKNSWRNHTCWNGNPPSLCCNPLIQVGALALASGVETWYGYWYPVLSRTCRTIHNDLSWKIEKHKKELLYSISKCVKNWPFGIKKPKTSLHYDQAHVKVSTSQDSQWTH